eukprot:372939-Prymnesium_polylepis.1
MVEYARSSEARSACSQPQGAPFDCFAVSTQMKCVCPLLIGAPTWLALPASLAPYTTGASGS